MSGSGHPKNNPEAQRQWAATWQERYSWRWRSIQDRGIKFVPVGFVRGNATILELERQINDGRQLSPVTA